MPNRSSRGTGSIPMKMPEVTGKLNMGTALIAAILAILGTLAGIAVTYGQYAKQIQVNERDIQEVRTTKASKEDVQQMKDNLIRIDQNVQKLTDHMIENNRTAQTRKSHGSR